MPSFNVAVKTIFNADEGAYSIVTEREATGDKSVTLDKYEKSVLFGKYPPQVITRAGGGPKDKNPDKQYFNVYDFRTQTYKKEKLAIKFPKSTGSELRLYFLKGTGFYPGQDDVFFIFTKKNEAAPFIGFLNKNDWDSFLAAGDKALIHERNYLIDEEDFEYQKSINSPKAPMKLRSAQGAIYDRSPDLALKALRKAGYKCEYNNDHETFIAAATSEKYMEAHHLVPVSKTPEFNVSLDVLANLVALCPNCHRKIHLSAPDEKKEIINKFFKEREKSLRESGIEVSIEKLYGFYGI